jgi:hypothetical protein
MYVPPTRITNAPPLLLPIAPVELAPNVDSTWNVKDALPLLNWEKSNISLMSASVIKLLSAPLCMSVTTRSVLVASVASEVKESLFGGMVPPSLKV